MLPPDIPEDPSAVALRRLQPFLGILFDLFGVPTARRPDILREATAELAARRQETSQSAHGWLLRRILRRCAAVEEEMFSAGGHVPDELIFRDPPEFPEPEEE
ncbi:MAG TPA: hypothetical protein VJ885_09700 [Thermoanaerobaculia bacterium]|nr:hypothetical protein [Thermoanaerobaculia bacterium]